MITKMSKVEIVGPKESIQDVIVLLKKLNVLQIEPESDLSTVREVKKDKVRPFLHDTRERALFERLFLIDLRRKIDELFIYFPKITARTSYIQPETIAGTVLHIVENHLKVAKTLHEQETELKQDVAELGHFAEFLNTLDSLFKDARTPPSFDIIGLTIKDQSSVDHIRAMVSKMTGGNFKFYTVPAGDGTLAGMITIEKDVAEAVSKGLTREHVPEMSFPPEFDNLSLPDKITYLEAQSLKLTMEIESIERELAEMGHRWMPLYQRIRIWIDERISLLEATASIYQTQMCFYLHGWMPSEDVVRLKAQLDASFGMQVVLEEIHVREKDLEQAPVVISNPPYFKPFEIFGRLLPLPAYTSLDPTPFIGIFFPIFFGMILGDSGYGVILAVLALFLRKKFAKNRDVANASTILLVSSLYTILFGLLYGELFGDLGERLFGLKPFLIDRRTSIVPMMLFALSAGVVHILVGLVLGAVTASKKHFQKEAIYKILNIVIIVLMVTVFASFFGYFPALLSKPIIIAILAITPFLLFTGGLLAPLELLKSIGNIISYVRIMAIGLTSVLLAYVANQLAGQMGDIVIGVTMAVMLHILNIVLGLFSPTIHSLRLHYVEFFSKFVESGGKKFEPLGK
ncbi:MAG TPA: V-type ATPase 116kDa subunit family protein [Nitrospirota bacterium]|nr:V-type ATPase 116kDa subunit family protein [Nitrospirota bacterium]